MAWHARLRAEEDRVSRMEQAAFKLVAAASNVLSQQGSVMYFLFKRFHKFEPVMFLLNFKINNSSRVLSLKEEKKKTIYYSRTSRITQ